MAPRSELLRAFLPTSPLVGHLGIALEELGADRAVLVMPFRPELVTIGDTVHGGAIAALADTAAMAAALAGRVLATTGVDGSRRPPNVTAWRLARVAYPRPQASTANR